MEIRLDPPHPDEVPDVAISHTYVHVDVDVPIKVVGIHAYDIGTACTGQAQIKFGDSRIGEHTLHVSGTADAIRAIGTIWPDIAIEIERQWADARAVAS